MCFGKPSLRARLGKAWWPIRVNIGSGSWPPAGRRVISLLLSWYLATVTSANAGAIQKVWRWQPDPLLNQKAYGVRGLWHNELWGFDYLGAKIWSFDGQTYRPGGRMSGKRKPLTALFTNDGIFAAGPDWEYYPQTYARDDISFSPDGSTLATCSSESFRIWDVERNHACDNLVHYGEDESEQGFGSPLCGDWSPDGTQLILGGSRGAVEVWDPRTLQRKRFLSHDGQEQHAVAIDWSQDGSMIAFGAEGEWDAQHRHHHGFVRVFDARTQRLIKELRDHDRLSRDVEFSPDGAWLVAEHDDGQLTRWDTVTWTAKVLIAPLDTPGVPLDGERLAFSFSHDGHELAVARTGPRVDYIDTESGQIRRTHTTTVFILNPQSEIEERASHEVNSIAFSSGEAVALAMPGGVTVLDRQTGDGLCRIPWKQSSNLTAVVSPERHIVVGSAIEKTVRCFNAQDGHELFRIEGPPGTAGSLARFSPDGNQLFIGGQWRLRGVIHRAMPGVEYERRAALWNEWSSGAKSPP